MKRSRNPFRATRRGEDIRTYPLKHNVNARIGFSTSYAILDAVIAANLDVEKYLKGGYDTNVLEQVVAWHKTNGLISAHQQDAIAIASERKK